MSAHGDVAHGPLGADGLPTWELRCGPWQEALADVERVDAVITDPPYGERTHKGTADMGALNRRALNYAYLTAADVGAFVDHWSPRVAGWFSAMTSDDLIGVWRASYAAAGRFDFAPVPVLQHRPRMAGDGPGSGAVYTMTARPREKRFMGWGSLPCWYHAGSAGPASQRDGTIIGGKPLGLMRAIVRDYSRPGDLVCDPCAGGATTLLAAVMEGRRAIGSELDPETFDKAVRRLREGYTPDLFTEAPAAPAAEQLGLLGGQNEE